MTPERYWAVMPVIIMATIGVVMLIYGIFRRQLNWLFAWFVAQPAWILGLISLALAGAMALNIWIGG